MSCDFRICSDNAVFGQPEHIIAQLAEGFAFCLGHGADIGTGNKALVAFAGQNNAADSLLIDCLKSSLQVSRKSVWASPRASAAPSVWLVWSAWAWQSSWSTLR